MLAISAGVISNFTVKIFDYDGSFKKLLILIHLFTKIMLAWGFFRRKP